jgi:hypothetical protein
MRRAGLRRAALAGALLAAAIGFGTTAGATAATTLQVTTDPGLFPAFASWNHDYVIACTGSPVSVSVQAPAGTQVNIDGQGFKTGSYTTTVAVTSGQAFRVLVATSTTSQLSVVRCLPPDFPTWTVLRRTSTAKPQAQFYVVTPKTTSFGAPNPGQQYLILFDAVGVPVYWIPTTVTTATGTTTSDFGTFLPDGNVAWTHWPNGPGEEHSLDGALVRKIGPNGGTIDLHDLVMLPNGNYLVSAITTRSGANLSSWGGAASTLTNVRIIDQVIYEVTPTGSVVWSWDAADHILPVETGVQWRPGILQNGPPYDVFHWNSGELDTTSSADGPSIVASFRHLNAVYKIKMADKSTIWKLGGGHRAESLTVVGDPVFDGASNFGGQHDARVMPDGTLTLHDNGTDRGRPVRGVQYRIDETAHTATLLSQVTDPTGAQSACCGSARLLPGGDWVASWGFTPLVTELDPAGNRVFGIRLSSPGHDSFRVIPVLPGQVTVQALRAGMDAQHPR